MNINIDEYFKNIDSEIISFYSLWKDGEFDKPLFLSDHDVYRLLEKMTEFPALRLKMLELVGFNSKSTIQDSDK